VVSSTTLKLEGGWQLNFDPSKSRKKEYTVRRISHPERGSFRLAGRIYDMDQAPDGQSMVYISYCDPDEVNRLIQAMQWSDVNRAITQTALKLLDLTDGSETTLIDCGAGLQQRPTFSPDGSSILFTAFDPVALKWKIYRADLAKGGSFTVNDITPTPPDAG
ncbi:MAG TPA: hypothetical protein VHL11_15410, partial [Phototrophicaceae bacterium]|jgi:dipeptidyl aminopeptidase/acylaminoacyl peptidase|nr:hypothetical protein [Phototrophicaceae bacterium]